MSKDKSKRPPENSPEFKKWLQQQAAQDMDDIFGGDYKPADFEEGGAIFGDIENLDKSDAELFPDEPEEYSPEERRKNFKAHDGGKKSD